MRDSLMRTFTGQTEGTPQWVDDLEKGDDRGFFGPGSAAWAVHGDMPTIVAGIRALLTQALHPGALAGVHDHSRYREDPFGRLTGTIRWIFTVTYGSEAAAVGASRWVQRIHERVVGTYPGADGSPVPYAASDPDLLRWVHLAFTDAFIGAHLVWGRKTIPGGPDAYVAEWALAGELMGVEDPPRTLAELRSQLREYLDAGILRHDERVDDVVRFLARPPLERSLRATYPVLFRGALASLDPEYRSLLGFSAPRGPVVAGTGLLLKATGAILGSDPAAERAARIRLARLDARTAH
ncbi:MAG: oxygenase MpaB family protein [Naasia sp.]